MFVAELIMNSVCFITLFEGKSPAHYKIHKMSYYVCRRANNGSNFFNYFSWHIKQLIIRYIKCLIMSVAKLIMNSVCFITLFEGKSPAHYKIHKMFYYVCRRSNNGSNFFNYFSWHIKQLIIRHKMSYCVCCRDNGSNFLNCFSWHIKKLTHYK